MGHIIITYTYFCIQNTYRTRYYTYILTICYKWDILFLHIDVPIFVKHMRHSIITYRDIHIYNKPGAYYYYQ